MGLICLYGLLSRLRILRNGSEVFIRWIGICFMCTMIMRFGCVWWCLRVYLVVVCFLLLICWMVGYYFWFWEYKCGLKLRWCFGVDLMCSMDMRYDWCWSDVLCGFMKVCLLFCFFIMIFIRFFRFLIMLCFILSWILIFFVLFCCIGMVMCWIELFSLWGILLGDGKGICWLLRWWVFMNGGVFGV